MSQTVSCLTSNEKELDVRSAVVLHLDPDLLPKGWLEETVEAARRAGQEVEDGSRYVIVCFAFNEGDRYRLYLDGVKDHLMYERYLAASLASAREKSRVWIGAGSEERSFREVPGIFQAAYHDWLTGQRSEIDPTTFIWALPVEGTAHYAVREFPPPAEGRPTKLTPNPSEVSFVALPRAAVEQMYRARGW